MPRDNHLSKIRPHLNSASITRLAQKLPWPYNGMVNDILGAIRTQGNYLAALGLMAYTEICGRQILFNGDNTEKDWSCFNKFLIYMGIGELLNKQIVFEGKEIQFVMLPINQGQKTVELSSSFG